MLSRETHSEPMLNSVLENLRFLLIEVEKQVDRTRTYVHAPDPAVRERITHADDYVDNLKDTIQSKVFLLAARSPVGDNNGVLALKAFEVMAINLERTSDFCEHVAAQVGYAEDKKVAASYDFTPFFVAVGDGVRATERALLKRDTQSALAVCQFEYELDALYSDAFKRVLADLAEGQSPQTVVTMLFIAHYLERMGDSLLNIGEAMLSAALGEKIKVDQFKSLQDSLEQSPLEAASGMSVGGVKETKSGARIRTVWEQGSDQPTVIFKDGKTKKLKEELRSVERWRQLFPGLTPQIHSFHEHGEDAAILFEFLPGRTLDEYLLKHSGTVLARALDQLEATLRRVMLTTRRDEPAKARFVHQLQSRLDDMQAVHPEFFTPGGQINGVATSGYRELVERSLVLDEELVAPFSTFVHGDFNVDNIIYDADKDAIHFIDLHRSRYLDYVQDVSVFLASNFRLQVLDVPARRQVDYTISRFFDFAHNHAFEVNDTTFPARLALGIARSLGTSTRFVLDVAVALDMFQRSRYLLERLLESHARGTLPQFVFRKEVLLG